MPPVIALLLLALLQTPTAPPSAAIRDEPLTPPTVVYPAEARAARIEGTVQLQVNVDATGLVTSVTALSGPSLLRQAAVDAYTHATYPPLITNGHPSPAIITTSVTFSLKQLPPDTDQLVDQQFKVLHTNCQQLSLTYQQDHSPETLRTCREAVQLSEHFSPQALLEPRATALNDLVLLLIADGKRSKALPEAGTLADRAITLVGSTGASLPHTPAVAVAYITRAEVRSLAGNLKGSAADCEVAEETLTTLLNDQAKDEKESERAGNTRVQLRETLLLHAIVLERDHKSADAKRLRQRAAII